MRLAIICLICGWFGALLGAISNELDDHLPVFWGLGLPSIVVILILIFQALGE